MSWDASTMLWLEMQNDSKKITGHHDSRSSNLKYSLSSLSLSSPLALVCAFVMKMPNSTCRFPFPDAKTSQVSSSPEQWFSKSLDQQPYQTWELVRTTMLRPHRQGPKSDFLESETLGIGTIICFNKPCGSFWCTLILRPALGKNCHLPCVEVQKNYLKEEPPLLQYLFQSSWWDWAEGWSQSSYAATFLLSVLPLLCPASLIPLHLREHHQ